MGLIPRQVTITGEVNRVAGPVARGYYLEPLTNEATGNPSRFPITVRLNGVAADELPVADGRARYVAATITTLELVGGKAGDRWRVVFLESEGDGVGGGAPPESRPVIIAEKKTWSAAEASGSGFYLPSANGASQQVTPIATPPECFDVTGYRTLHLYVGAILTAKPAQTAQLVVTLTFCSEPMPFPDYDGLGGVQLVVETYQQRFAIVGENQGPVAVGFDYPPDVVPTRVTWVRLHFAVVNAESVDDGSYIRLVGLT